MMDANFITYRHIQRFFLRFLVGVCLVTVGFLLPLHVFKSIDIISMFIVVVFIVPISLLLYDVIHFWVKHRKVR